MAATTISLADANLLVAAYRAALAAQGAAVSPADDTKLALATAKIAEVMETTGAHGVVATAEYEAAQSRPVPPIDLGWGPMK